jgi:TetR/AcrR family transcriptional repressor of nem operon
MRKSKLEAAETRRHIVKTAAAEFRQHGINGTALADLMAASGLTHGGFYRHFTSKDQIVKEACALAVASEVEAAELAVLERAGQSGVAAFAKRYLTTQHRDHPAIGCPFAALASEIVRSDGDTRAVATEGFLKLVDVVTGQAGRSRPTAARRKAIVALSTMIGALTMSRLVDDAELSDTILEETGKHLARL